MVSGQIRHSRSQLHPAGGRCRRVDRAWSDNPNADRASRWCRSRGTDAGQSARPRHLGRQRGGVMRALVGAFALVVFGLPCGAQVVTEMTPDKIREALKQEKGETCFPLKTDTP